MDHRVDAKIVVAVGHSSPMIRIHYPTAQGHKVETVITLDTARELLAAMLPIVDIV